MTIDYTDHFAKWPKDEQQAARTFRDDTGPDGVLAFPIALVYFAEPRKACVALFYLVNRSAEDEVFSDWALEAPPDWKGKHEAAFPTDKADHLIVHNVRWLSPPTHRLAARDECKLAVYYESPNWLARWMGAYPQYVPPTCTIQVQTSHAESKHAIGVVWCHHFANGPDWVNR